MYDLYALYSIKKVTVVIKMLIISEIIKIVAWLYLA